MPAMEERMALLGSDRITTTEVVSVPLPDVQDLTLGVVDLTDTGFVTDDPAVLIWLATVAERGMAW